MFGHQTSISRIHISTTKLCLAEAIVCAFLLFRPHIIWMDGAISLLISLFERKSGIKFVKCFSACFMRIVTYLYWEDSFPCSSLRQMLQGIRSKSFGLYTSELWYQNTSPSQKWRSIDLLSGCLAIVKLLIYQAEHWYMTIQYTFFRETGFLCCAIGFEVTVKFT